MAVNEDFKNFVLDQLQGLGEYEMKNMFGGTALLKNGLAFAKIKHDKVWLKADVRIKACSNMFMGRIIHESSTSMRLLLT